MTRSILVAFLIGSGCGVSGGEEVEPTTAPSPDRAAQPTHDESSATVHLEVSVEGPGRITSDPAGIDCGAGGTACAMERSGSVTLHASADSTVRWGGACAGNARTCAVNGDAPVSVIALTFPPLVVTFDSDEHREDMCHAIAGTAGGGFVITGEVQRLVEGRNAWTGSYDSAGALSWSHELHTPSEGSDAGRGVVVLPDGSVVVVGEWFSGSSTHWNNVLEQLGTTGSVLGSEVAEIIGDDLYRAVARLPTGELVVAGSLGTQAWIRKLGPAGGAESWSVTRGVDAVANRIAVIAEDDFVVAGNDGDHGWVARYCSGVELWSFDTFPGDTATDVATFPGGFAVAGGPVGFGWLRVYNDDAVLQWNIPVLAGWSWGAVAANADGTIILGGQYLGDLAVRVYEADGTLRWQETNAASSVNAAAFDADGNVLVCGTHTSGGNMDMIAIKYPQ
jgi:hypothetical protein